MTRKQVCPHCYSTYYVRETTGKETGETVGSAAAIVTGAAIGSVVPVVGTVFGIAVGSILTRMGVGYATRKAFSALGEATDRYKCQGCKERFIWPIDQPNIFVRMKKKFKIKKNKFY